MTTFALVVLIAAAVGAVLGVYCLLSPIVLTLRAPDGGDLFMLRIRHPALSLDLWVPPELILAWALGERPLLPGMHGEFMGIPVRRSWVTRRIETLETVRRWRPARRKPAGARPAEPWRDRILRDGPAWLELGREMAPRFGRSIRVETLRVEVEYGTGSPDSTGQITSALWFLEPWLPEGSHIEARPIWTGPRFHLQGDGRVVIFPWRALWVLLCLWFRRRNVGAERQRKQRQHGRIDSQGPDGPARKNLQSGDGHGHADPG